MHPCFVIGAMLMTATAGDPAMPPGVASLVEAERAFAKMAETASVRDAFLANLADGALLFNPGPVDGRALYEARAPSAAVLAWQPVYAEIAASEDFGFTTGPWSFSPDRKSDPVAFGHFVSVWKKPAGGSWKVAVDIGIGHERMAATPALTFRVSEDPDPWPRDAAGMAEKRASLLAADGAFADAFARDAAGAFGACGAPDVRRYRDGAAPVLGRAAVMAAAGTGGGGVMRATGAEVAPSGDLGYTAGYRGAPVAAYYVRIWRLEENRVWKVVLDIESVVPEGD